MKNRLEEEQNDNAWNDVKKEKPNKVIPQLRHCKKTIRDFDRPSPPLAHLPGR